MSREQRDVVHRILCILTLSALLAAPGSGEAGGGSWDRVAKQIQEACILAYPTDMLAELTGAEEVPADLVDDVEEQRDFFIDLLQGDKGRFYPFFLEDLLPAFERYVKPGMRFLDLGSGDGRVVFLAAAMGAEATGIEYDSRVAEVSRQALSRLADTLDSSKVKIIQDDFFNHSWADYDVIFYFDMSSFEQMRVRKKIAYELGTEAKLLVGFEHSPFPGLELESSTGDINIYRQPRLLHEFNPHMLERCKKEVAEVHRFLESWYLGTPEAVERGLERFEAVLSPSFTMIDETGAIHTRDQAIGAARRARGSWNGVEAARLQIADLRLHLIDSSTAVVSYREGHHVAEGRREYRTTAVLQLRVGYPNEIIWHHVHRTLMAAPKRPQNLDPSARDSGPTHPD